MFTGIIETIGTVEEVKAEGTNKHFRISCPLTTEFHIDQSICHNGVCLTVTAVEKDSYWVTAVDETLKKSNLGDWQKGHLVNIERSMPANGRFDGHIVQGHVDGTAVCTSVMEQDGSWIYTFRHDYKHALIVEKGSICVNGISLTCFDITDHTFSVAIIPYTYEHTNLKEVVEGTRINLEFDIVGKYISRINQQNPPA